MKKFVFLLLIFSLSIFTVISQEGFSFETMEDTFGQFAADISSQLPFAATMGLNWSDSYIGNFPHFGAGIMAGAVFLPQGAFDKLFTDTLLPASTDNPLDQLPLPLGTPFPAAAVEARLGGFVLPFDIGIKVGLIPESVELNAFLPEGMNIEYMLLGADVRINLLKQKLLIPNISIGAGYNFMKGGISVAGILGEGDVEISSFTVPNDQTYDITMTNPAMSISWITQTIDAKAQASWSLLIFTPYVGAGASYGFSKAGGGVTASLKLNGTDLTQTKIDQIIAAFEAMDETPPDLTLEGIISYAENNGFSFRAFGGLSVDLLFLHLDLTAMYNIVDGTLGATAGFRLQL